MLKKPDDTLYLAALGAVWYAGRITLIRYRAEIQWTRREVSAYTFLVVGSLILLIASLLENTAAKMPIFLVGLGFMLWSYLSLRWRL